MEAQTKVPMSLILATDRIGGLGLGKGLPWDHKKDSFEVKLDKALFRDFTRRKKGDRKNLLVAGSNTYDSVVGINDANRTVVSIRDFLSMPAECQAAFGRIIIIGGAKTYKYFLENYEIETIQHSIFNEEFESDVKFDIKPYLPPNAAKCCIRVPRRCKKKDYQVNDLDVDTYECHIYGKDAEVDNCSDDTYLDLVEDALYEPLRETRNGFTRSGFSAELEFDLQEGFPLLTTKCMNIEKIREELIDLFVNGRTNAKGLKIWELNTSREFLDNRELFDYPVGEMGPMYGFNWRHFGAKHKPGEQPVGGYDQLAYCINEIITNPTSRRIIMTTYDPSTVDKCVLYPCHGITTQFYVRDDILDCKVYIRSSDVMLGLPYNVASYALLLTCIASICNLSPGRLIVSLGDYHIYAVHEINAYVQMARPKHRAPMLAVKKLNNITDLEQLKLSDIELSYESEGLLLFKLV